MQVQKNARFGMVLCAMPASLPGRVAASGRWALVAQPCEEFKAPHGMKLQLWPFGCDGTSAGQRQLHRNLSSTAREPR